MNEGQGQFCIVQSQYHQTKQFGVCRHISGWGNIGGWVALPEQAWNGVTNAPRLKNRVCL